MKKFEYKALGINDLYINPENYRYINEADDEIDAIIHMFSVTTGTPVKEMFNLAKDIVEDGLNPFEMPIVYYDDDLQKYIVLDGNRRITCIKLMTQYKDNKDIVAKIPSTSEIYKLNYEQGDIQCVVFTNQDDAKRFLYKIHQDVNEGIGRKQWDYQAKMKADAAKGNKSRTYSIVEFLKNNPDTDKSLITDMDTNRWISKLERVVGFAKFRETYNVTFGTNNSLIYIDSEKQTLVMMSKLVQDLICNSATNNFRFKDDFENYVAKLDSKYKTQVSDNTEKKEAKQPSNLPESNSSLPDNRNANNANESNKETRNSNNGFNSKDSNELEKLPPFDTPRAIPKKYITEKASALRLGKEYNIDDYNCLNSKGKDILIELESLDIKAYPFAAATLCRALLECVLKLWIEVLGEGTFNSSSLQSTYNGCLNLLREKDIIDNKENSVLKVQVNKEDYITLLNTWIHSDTSACVSETNLVSGWKNTRLLIEKYIDKHKK